MSTDIPWPKDVFKRPLQIGDMIAAGMSYGQSSVLRVGEVVNIKASKPRYGRENEAPRKFSVRVKWRNNGDQNPRYQYGEVKDSNFIYEEGHSYAKFIILDRAFVEQYPADIKPADEV
jgi:hypothetical protein